MLLRTHYAFSWLSAIAPQLRAKEAAQAVEHERAAAVASLEAERERLLQEMKAREQEVKDEALQQQAAREAREIALAEQVGAHVYECMKKIAFGLVR